MKQELPLKADSMWNVHACIGASICFLYVYVSLLLLYVPFVSYVDENKNDTRTGWFQEIRYDNPKNSKENSDC